jgi:hypothetical protein
MRRLFIETKKSSCERQNFSLAFGALRSEQWFARPRSLLRVLFQTLCVKTHCQNWKIAESLSRYEVQAFFGRGHE